jgi:hypothetical protein
MCCGQKRSTLQSVPTATIAPAARRSAPTEVTGHTTVSPQTPAARRDMTADLRFRNTPAQTSPPHSSVSLRYLENSPVQVRGPVTGLHYQFSGASPIQAVDVRDAAALLRTRFFRQTGMHKAGT